MRYSIKSILSVTVLGGALGAGLMLSAAPASALTVDGELSDWGITVGDSNTSNFSSLNTGIGIVSSFAEDQNDNSNNHYLGPNYGGQNYDVEFIGMAMQGSIMYLAIVTGQRPDNGLSTYSPGGIYMTTPFGIVGIEVGGGPGGGDANRRLGLGECRLDPQSHRTSFAGADEHQRREHPGRHGGLRLYPQRPDQPARGHRARARRNQPSRRGRHRVDRHPLEPELRQ